MYTEQEWRQHPQSCANCGHAMIVIEGTLEYPFEGYTITVHDVPMNECPNCGEQYIPGPVAEPVGDLVMTAHRMMQQHIAQREDRRPTVDAMDLHYRSNREPAGLATA